MAGLFARAVTAGNANRARRLMNDHLLERQAYLERQPARRRRRVAEAKRASGLARQIGDQVRRRRWLPGRRIGSEPELTLRYGVSRSIFREAVRMLEQHGIAEMPEGFAAVCTSPNRILRR